MTEAVLGLVGLGLLVAALFTIDLLLTRRQRRRLAAGEPGGGRRGDAADRARTGSQANSTSSGTYLF